MCVCQAADKQTSPSACSKQINDKTLTRCFFKHSAAPTYAWQGTNPEDRMPSWARKGARLDTAATSNSSTTVAARRRGATISSTVTAAGARPSVPRVDSWNKRPASGGNLSSGGKWEQLQSWCNVLLLPQCLKRFLQKAPEMVAIAAVDTALYSMPPLIPALQGSQAAAFQHQQGLQGAQLVSRKPSTWVLTGIWLPTLSEMCWIEALESGMPSLYKTFCKVSCNKQLCHWRYD